MKGVNDVLDGVLIDIEVSPKSKSFEIVEYNDWRERIEIRIKSPPFKGKANKEIINEFSRITGNPVEIISGLKSRQKTLKIYNLSKSEFLNIMGRYGAL